MGDEWSEDSVGPSADVLKRDVGNAQACLTHAVSLCIGLCEGGTYGMFETLIFIVLSITLRDRDTIVDVV